MAEEHTIQWPKNIQYNGRRTYNTMAEEHTIQWPKNIQYNGRRKWTTRQTIINKKQNSATTTQLKIVNEPNESEG